MVPESFNFLIKYRFTSLAPMGHRGSARDPKEALLADTPSTPTTGSFVLKILPGGIVVENCSLIFAFQEKRGGGDPSVRVAQVLQELRLRGGSWETR